MKYAIEIAPVVDRQLQRFPKPDRKKILHKIESLAIEPRPYGYKELVGFNGYNPRPCRQLSSHLQYFR